MTKNIQTINTIQLCSFHMLAKLCSKFPKPVYNNSWTVNLQMIKLVSEKAEESETKLPTSVGPSKRQESSRKTSTSASLTRLKPLTVWITTNWEILKEMGIPDHLTCVMSILYVDQEAIIRIGHGTMHWFKIGKGVCQGYILPPYLLNFYAEYIMLNARQDESQTEIKIARRNINSLRYADDITKWQKVKRN